MSHQIVPVYLSDDFLNRRGRPVPIASSGLASSVIANEFDRLSMSVIWDDMPFNGTHFTGRTSRVLIECITATLAALKRLGYTVESSDKQTYSHSKGVQFTVKCRVGIYMTILQNFLKLIPGKTKILGAPNDTKVFWYSSMKSQKWTVETAKFPPPTDRLDQWVDGLYQTVLMDRNHPTIDPTVLSMARNVLRAYIELVRCRLTTRDLIMEPTTISDQQIAVVLVPNQLQVVFAPTSLMICHEEMSETYFYQDVLQESYDSIHSSEKILAKKICQYIN